MIIPFIRKRYILFVLILGLILRLVILDQSLWLDEAIGAVVARDFSYSKILTDFIKADNHSPLYYLMLKAWTSIFGYSELALRLPSVIFGILTIYFTYKIARLLIAPEKKNFPIIAALLLSVSSFHIYYSQEARMYSMAALFATAAFYYFLLILKNIKISWKNWLLFSLSITILLFTDYVPVFLLPVFWVTAFLKRKDVNFWKYFLIAHLPLVISGILWLPTFLYQAERGSWLLRTWPEWKSVAGGATLEQFALVWAKFVFGRISLTNKGLYYLLVASASIPVLVSILNSWKNRQKSMIGIWLWLIVPLSLGFLVSFNFPAFIYFRFVYVVSAYYLIIAWGIGKIHRYDLKMLLLGVVIVSNLTSWFIYISDTHQQREQWRAATKFVEENTKSNEIVIFDFPEPFAPYRWYSKDLVEAKGATDSISANREPTTKRTFSLIDGKSGIYYFEYLRDISDPNRYVENTLYDQGFTIKEVYNFTGVGQIFHFVK